MERGVDEKSSVQTPVESFYLNMLSYLFCERNGTQCVYAKIFQNDSFNCLPFSIGLS